MNTNQLDISSIKLLENDFQDVLNSLTQDQKFIEFKKHYENMLDMLKQSHSKEIEINKNCNELSKNIQENASKIKAVMNIAQTDQQTIDQLKKDLQDAKSIFLIQKEKDETNRKKMENLSKMWKNLEIITKQNQEINSEKIEKYNSLLEQKKQFTNDITTVKQNNNKLDQELQDQQLILQQKKKQYQQLETEYVKQDKITNESSQQIQKINDRLQINQIEINNSITQKNIYLNQLHEEQKNYKQIEGRFLSVCDILKETLQEKNQLQLKQIKLETLNQQQNNKLDDLNQSIDKKNEQQENLQQKIKEQKTKNNLLILKHKQQLRDQNSIVMKLKKINNEISQIQQENKLLKNNFQNYNKKIITLKQQTNQQQESLQNLYNGYQNIKNTCKNLSQDNEQNFLKINEVLQRNNILSNQINPLKNKKVELEKQKQIQFKENEKMVQEINQYHIKLNNIQEELLLLDNIISEVQKKSVETEQFLQDQQLSYEKERMDRNIYSKNLKETQDEISEMKRKTKIAINQIDQLKEEYQGQQEVITQEKKNAEQLFLKFQQNCKKNENLKEKQDQKLKMVKNLVNQISKLKIIQNQFEGDIQKLALKNQKIISERDLFLQNLIQKNDEILLLKEKVDAQQQTLNEGESQYQSKTNEIQYLKILFKELNNEIFINKNKVKNIFKYQDKIQELSEKIQEEELKVKALSEELENPLNVNRWRNIGEQNLDSFELIDKIQHIQKKLIRKTEHIISYNLKISSQKDSMKNLSTIQKQNPGLKEAKVLLLVQKKSKQGYRRLKSAAGELNLYKFKKQELNLKIKEIQQEIESYKKKFAIQLKKTLKNNDKIQIQAQIA